MGSTHKVDRGAVLAALARARRTRQEPECPRVRLGRATTFRAGMDRRQW